MYYSQANQDRWVCESLGFKRGGTFIDIGAYDGIQTSNTYFLEKELGWSGVCVEANPAIFQQLLRNRRSINLNLAVSDYAGTCFFSGDAIAGQAEGIQVPCDTLNHILEACQAPAVIDYLSLDIEGHEFAVLHGFDFDRWRIRLMTVEHNLYCDGPEKKDRLYRLLTARGFERVVDNAVCLDPNPQWFQQPYEDWYAHRSFLVNEAGQ